MNWNKKNVAHFARFDGLPRWSITLHGNAVKNSYLQKPFIDFAAILARNLSILIDLYIFLHVSCSGIFVGNSLVELRPAINIRLKRSTRRKQEQFMKHTLVLIHRFGATKSATMHSIIRRCTSSTKQMSIILIKSDTDRHVFVSSHVQLCLFVHFNFNWMCVHIAMWRRVNKNCSDYACISSRHNLMRSNNNLLLAFTFVLIKTIQLTNKVECAFYLCVYLSDRELRFSQQHTAVTKHVLRTHSCHPCDAREYSATHKQIINIKCVDMEYLKKCRKKNHQESHRQFISE